MEIVLHKDRAGWVSAYLTIWQGFLSLTERELELLALIALRYLDLQVSVSSEALIAELLLNPEARKSYRADLQNGQPPVSANNLQNHLASLKKKGALRETGGKLILWHRLIPSKTITFTFADA